MTNTIAQIFSRKTIWLAVVACTIGFFPLRGMSDDEVWVEQAELRRRVIDAFKPPRECKSLHRDNRIWIHRNEQVVILDGYIAQTQVPLELFACPTGTKEHESIVAVFARAQSVHAGLLAIDAKPGSTATFEPFKPATGTTVRIYALWIDNDGKTQGSLAQNWIRRMGTKKPMYWDWVFAGSKIHKDDEGKEHYLGDSGELISVSNFSTSTMDLAVRSEQSNANLLFEAFTERIPRRNTPVRLVITITDEAPYGILELGDDSLNAKEPKHISDQVPESVMQFLVPAKKKTVVDAPK